MDHIKNAVKSEWDATDMGQPNKIVGIEITFKDGAVIISQQKYIENLPKKEDMADANPVAMPMDSHIQLIPNPKDNELNSSNLYAKLVGELQYIANCTCPDILYPINQLAAYTANPSLQHWGAVKCILQYLAGTTTLGIIPKMRLTMKITSSTDMWTLLMQITTISSQPLPMFTWLQGELLPGN